MSRRLSVVLFNLGGPDCLEAVKPFLFNLFNDSAIIALPQPFRWLIAKAIASRRTPTAMEIYRKMGGRSPLLPETEAQRSALEDRLHARFPDDSLQVVIAMRHWTPFTAEAVKTVEQQRPEHVILLPLYPHYSTTTTGSSLQEWRRLYKGSGAVHVTCCYPQQAGFIEAHADRIRQTCETEDGLANYRIVFSAHGLPQKVIDEGDPYQDQVERSVQALVDHLGLKDWRVCYQSRVGPLKWIGPSTHEVILEAGRDGANVMVVPIAFVSEHSETLVELDIDYRMLASEVGVPSYLRAPAIGVDPYYIEALSDMVANALEAGSVSPQGPSCQGRFAMCPFQRAQAA